MAKKITKAVIPAAGLGTRMLPIARVVPKEMLPIVDRPAISYLVEEAADSGATDILIITGRNKGAIEDYFDFSPEYENKLHASGKDSQIEYLRSIAKRANVFFIRQRETMGLGHAIKCARSFTADDPFFVLYGDDIIFSQTPVCKQLANAYEKYGLASCGVKEVPRELVKKYCSLKVSPLGDDIYKVFSMVEKPKTDAEIYSCFSILGRVLLTGDVYDILDNTPLGAGGELQLTDAMKVIAESLPTGGMTAVDFEGKRYDMGSKLGFLYANVEQAVKNPELGEEFKAYLREFVKTL